MSGFFALVAGAWLYQKYGWRTVFITGSFMFATEIFMILFAEDVNHAAFVAGRATGRALGLVE